MDISLLSKLINDEPTYFNENEMVDSNNLYTYGDVTKLILKFYDKSMNAYKIASRDGVSSFILNNKDLTLKLTVSPYTFKVYRVDKIDTEHELANGDIEKYWQRILIKRNGQKYFDNLEKHYYSKIEKIKEVTSLDLKRTEEQSATNEQELESLKCLIKQKKNLANFKIKMLNNDLADLRRYLRIIQITREVKGV